MSFRAELAHFQAGDRARDIPKACYSEFGMSFQAELAQFQAGNGASNIARPVLQDLRNFVLPIFISLH